VIDLERRQLALTNAGLPLPLLQRGDTLTTVQASGVPVGMFDAGDYDQAVINLQPGDRLFFYTDGLSDSLGDLHPRKGEGDEQVQTILTEHSSKPAAELADLFVHYLRSSRHRNRQKELSDDTTFLVLRAL
jgi:sigma-B regulation protein RsbU (phosphoserine phosphatase)